jgi:hypothetical protein
MVSSFNVKCKSDGEIWASDLIYYIKLWANGDVKVTKDTEYANRLLCNERAAGTAVNLICLKEELEYLL